MLGSWGSAWEMCSSGKVYGEHAACSFPGKSKSHLAASLLGLKEEAQTPRGACPLHPAGRTQMQPSRLRTHSAGVGGGRVERTHAELSGGRPQTQESGALLIQQRGRGGSHLALPCPSHLARTFSSSQRPSPIRQMRQTPGSSEHFGGFLKEGTGVGQGVRSGLSYAGLA